MEDLETPNRDCTLFEPTSLHQLGIALFSALVLLIAISTVPVLGTAFDFLVALNLHELGHATASNLGGRFSVPTPMGFAAYLTKDRTILCLLAFLCAYGALAWSARKSGFSIVSWIFAAAFIAQLIVSLFLSQSAFEQLCIWSGQGGELIWGGLLAALFVIPLPERFHWTKNRYLFFAVGLVLLVTASRKWIEAATDRSKLPWGSIWQGLGMHGDLNRLRDEFGWTESGILFSYLGTAVICWVVVIGLFIVAVIGSSRVCK